MAQIDTLLATDSRCERVAIVGLGGVGKTQIALEFAYQWREKHAAGAVFWIPVTSVESMLEAYLEMGRQLQIPDLEKTNVQDLVQRRLSQESSGRWLLVFDNADDIRIWTEKADSTTGSGRRIDYLPKSKRGSILFTTRSRKAATKLAGKNVVSVREMDESMAKDLLKESLIDQDVFDDDAAAHVLQRLTHLPLAIVQAAAYINENTTTLAKYAELLDDTEQNRVDLLSQEFEDEGRYGDIKNPVATTWLISFEQIQTRNPLAAEYLSFMSCVDAKDIPESLLPPAQSTKAAVDAIGTLSAYSFITRTKHETDPQLDLHRLVHLATRNWLRMEGVLGVWTAKSLERLEDVFPDCEHTNKEVWRMYVPHVRYALASQLDEGVETERTELLWKFGECVRMERRYKEAEKAFAQVMQTRTRELGAEHPDTITSMNKLGLMYWIQERRKEAAELFVRVRELRKRVFGEKHPDTLTSMPNLGLVYPYGKQELVSRVLETCKSALGTPANETILTRDRIAKLDKQTKISILWRAVKDGDQGLVEKLLQSGVDPNVQDLDGRTPLLLAIVLHERGVIGSLLEWYDVESDHNGWTPVDIELKNKQHQTPLWWAAREGLEDVVRVLLNTGRTDANSRDWKGLSPLCWAAHNGLNAVVRQLLSCGTVGLDCPELKEWTPLLRAAMNGHEEVVRILLAHGADPECQDSDGSTPEWLASIYGHARVLRWLPEGDAGSEEDICKSKNFIQATWAVRKEDFGW
jgi:hypothetical protein